MSPRSTTPRARRTWPQRLLISFNVVAILGALGTAGVVAWGKDTVGEVPRVQIRSKEFSPARELPAGDPVNFLIVGTDSAEGLDPDDPLLRGRDDVSGTRSDVVMVVRLDPKEGTASMVSFPRDLWVEIPGHGKNRINTAVAYGDGEPALLIDTIKANFGIPINHYVQVNFAAFKNIVADIGGVKVFISHPMRDGHAGLDLPEAGCMTLDQHQALAYSRTRKLEWKDASGRWRYDPTGDLGRIKRQQDFVKRTISQAIDKGARNPATLARLIRTGVEHITLDPYTTPQDLVDLGRAFDTFDPEELRTIEIPVVDATRGGADVLDAVEPATSDLLAPFRGVDQTRPDGSFEPSTINVRVVNGTHRPREGAITTDRFADVGFRVLDPRDSAETVARTIVTYHPTAEAQARFVARFLDGDPVLQADAQQGDAIVVTTGPDLVGVLSFPKPAPESFDTATTTTTSTVPTTTTTTATTTTTTTMATTATTSVPMAPGTITTAPYVAGEVPEGASC